jgi:hypothetical protein
MNIFRNEKFLSYKDEIYSYEELKLLKTRYPQFCKDGIVLNLETGRIEEIERLEMFYKDALQESNVIIKNSTLSSQTKYEINNKIIKNFDKEVLDNIYEKIKNDTATYEDVNYYWEIKQPLSNKIEHYYKMKDFAKVSLCEYKEELFKNLSLIDKGRIMELMNLLSFDNQTTISRTFLMKRLEFKDAEMFRRFMKTIEDNEIVYRMQKQNKKSVIFVLNPFIFMKHSQRELSIELFEMFPKSFKIFLPLDVYIFFKLKHKKELSKINIENFY